MTPAVVFIKVWNWEELKYQSTGEWINKEILFSDKKNTKPLIHSTIWINLRIIMLKKLAKSQSSKMIIFHDDMQNNIGVNLMLCPQRNTKTKSDIMTT